MDIIHKLQIHSQKIRQFGVIKIGLFGSFVKNRSNEKSDIDLLVEFSDAMENFDNYMDLKFFLEDIFQHRVDLVITSTIKPQLKREILENVEYV